MSSIVQPLLMMLLFLASASASAQWRYWQETDKMRDNITKFAELKSTNRIQLDFPYRGGSTLRLVIRKTGQEDESIFVLLDRGQLSCHSDCKIAAKIDSAPVVEWGGSSPVTSNSVIFIGQRINLLNDIRSAKKMVIEVQVYDHGPAQFVFNSPGLRWE